MFRWVRVQNTRTSVSYAETVWYAFNSDRVRNAPRLRTGFFFFSPVFFYFDFLYIIIFFFFPFEKGSADAKPTRTIIKPVILSPGREDVTFRRRRRRRRGRDAFPFT